MTILMELANFAMAMVFVFVMLIATIFIYRAFGMLYVRLRILEAFRVKRLREEIGKRKIDFLQMMDEHKEICQFVLGKKQSTKGTLDRIDEEVTGEIEDEPKKGKKAN